MSSKVYKEGYEPAVITEIDYKEYLVTVRPVRNRADEYRTCPDSVAATTERALKDKAEEEIKKKVEKTVTRVNQLSIFDFI